MLNRFSQSHVVHYGSNPTAETQEQAMIHPFLNTATKAAREAAALIVKMYDKVDLLEVDEKSHNNFVTQVDKEAERIIVDIIHSTYPRHAILAEEGSMAEQGDDDTEHCWIIDPLDGTTNFIHGYPHFAISIAVESRGKIEHGLIYDPLREEMFTASRGKGAQLNSRRIRVSKRPSLEGALLATGFPFRNPEILGPHIESLHSLFKHVAGVRRGGAAALDLAHVAAGRLDGYWEAKLQPWDLAAGMLLVREAGGITADYDGSSKCMENGQIVAANPKILHTMMQVITPLLGNKGL